MEVSHCTTNLEEEDGTEVRHQEEATSNQPVPEGTEIPCKELTQLTTTNTTTALRTKDLLCVTVYLNPTIHCLPIHAAYT